ncbi:unnamed protein product [Urochloa humidicola]
MTTFSCGSDSEGSSDHSGETQRGPDGDIVDAEVAIGSLVPHDLPSDGLEDDAADTLNSVNGDGGQVANNINRRPSVDKVDEEEEDKVREDIKGSEQKGKDDKKLKKKSDGNNLKLKENRSDKEEDEDLKLKEEQQKLKEERANRNTLLLLTVLLVLAMPVVVWRSIN